MPSKMWDETVYSLTKCNGSTIEVWEWICYITLHFLRDVGIEVNPYWDPISQSAYMYLTRG